MVRSPYEAEELAAEWMRFLGYPDAVPTQRSRDGGIDVDSARAIAQVKMHATPVGRPALQQLHGVATSVRKQAIFFSLMSYSRDAIAWGDSMSIALFRFNHAGEIDAENAAAQFLLNTAEANPASSAPRTRPAFAMLSEGHLLTMVEKDRQRGLSKEKIDWVVQAWLTLVGLQEDYTVAEYGPTPFTSQLWFESIQGTLYRPTATPTGTRVPENTPCMVGGASARVIKEAIIKSFRSYGRVTKPATLQRYATELQQQGVLASTTSLALTETSPALLPVVVAVYSRKREQRLVVWDAATGAVSSDLIRAFYGAYRWSVPEVHRVGRRLG